MDKLEAIFRQRVLNEYMEYAKSRIQYRELITGKSKKDVERIDNLICGAMSRGIDDGIMYSHRKARARFSQHCK